jgi:uncharacterized protein YktA (UPF0223 family)
MGGTDWEPEIAIQLYQRIKKNYDGKFAVQDFFDVYLQADEILREKIQNAETAIEDLFAQ